METILDSAHTWFLERCTQLPSGELIIRLAEGVKGPEKLPVSVGDKVIGQFFPVTVEPISRIAEVRFSSALVLLSCNESYDSPDESLVVSGKGTLRKVEQSSFRKFLTEATNAVTLGQEPLSEYFLWTENQVFKAFCSGEPVVTEISDQPDSSIERYNTWYAA